MARIELELNPKVYQAWRQFMISTPAAKLMEAGVLGDWVAVGFMANVERYLEQGRPDGATQQKALDPASHEAAQARRKLPKALRRVLPMFNENDRVTMKEISRVLGLAPDEGAAQVQEWLEEGFLEHGPERDGQPTFLLGHVWQMRNLIANRPSLNVPRIPHLMRPIKP
ncbi:MarR family transcriptional regulator [Desulfarculales bacterium]